MALPRTAIYILHPFEHFKHVFSVMTKNIPVTTFQSPSGGGLSCKSHHHQRCAYCPWIRMQNGILFSLEGQSANKRHTKIRNKHSRRSASTVSVAIQQHTGVDLSFVFQLFDCFQDLAKTRGLVSKLRKVKWRIYITVTCYQEDFRLSQGSWWAQHKSIDNINLNLWTMLQHARHNCTKQWISRSLQRRP